MQNKILLAVGVLAIVVLWKADTIAEYWNEWRQPDLPPAQTREEVTAHSSPDETPTNTVTDTTLTNTTDVAPTNTTTETNTSSEPVDVNVAELPTAVNLAVPFTSQAPHANWDLPYQEACEETSAFMVHLYWDGATTVTRDEADAGILDLVAFQEARYGFYKDTTAEETARFIRDRWGYDVDVLADFTANMLRAELANGYPIIVPAAGRELGNPNFTQPGPVYHMLVIKGYTDDGRFITNDPGTRNGKDYVYTEFVLINAIHDWNDGDVPNGNKRAIIVRGES